MSGCCKGPGQWDDGVPAGQSASSSARIVSALFRFDQMATVALADGPTTLVDTNGIALPVTVGNVGAAATFRILNGTGLEFVANATNSQYNSNAQTASFIEALYPDLYATYGVDASYDMRVRIHTTVRTFPTNNVTGGLTLGVRGVTGSPSNSTNRYRGILTFRQNGVQTMVHATDGTGGQNYVLPTVPSLPDVYGIQHEQAAMRAHAGRWGGSFDDTPMLFDVGDQPATSPNTGGYRDSGNILALGFGTGNALADVRVTIDQLRIDWRAAA